MRVLIWLKNYVGILILFFMLGVLVGVKVSVWWYSYRMSEVVKVGAFVYDGKVYDIKERFVR